MGQAGRRLNDWRRASGEGGELTGPGRLSRRSLGGAGVTAKVSKRRILWFAVLLGLGVTVPAVWQWRVAPLRALRSAAARNDWLSCLELAKQELAGSPDQPTALAWAARAAIELGRWDAAQQYGDRLTLPAAALLCRLGEGYAEQARWSKALAVFDRWLELYPDDVIAKRKLAAVHFKLGRWDLAQHLAESLAAVPGQSAAAHCLLGAIHSSLGHHTEAVAYLQKSLDETANASDLPVDRAELSLLLGQSLVQLGRASEAESYLQEVAAMKPSTEVFHLLALVRLQQRDPEGTRNWANQVLSHNRRHAPTFEILGLLAEQQNRLAESAGWYRLAIRHAIDPSAGLHYALAQVYTRLGRRDLAVPQLVRMSQLQNEEQRRESEDRVLERQPDGPEAIFVRARRAFKKGDLAQAEELLGELFARFADRPEVKKLKQDIEAQRLAQQGRGLQQ